MAHVSCIPFSLPHQSDRLSTPVGQSCLNLVLRRHPKPCSQNKLNAYIFLNQYQAPLVLHPETHLAYTCEHGRLVSCPSPFTGAVRWNPLVMVIGQAARAGHNLVYAEALTHDMLLSVSDQHLQAITTPCDHFSFRYARFTVPITLNARKDAAPSSGTDTVPIICALENNTPLSSLKTASRPFTPYKTASPSPCSN